MNLLRDLPLASLLTIVTCVLAVYLVVSNRITLNTPDEFLKFATGLGVVIAGYAVLGEVRNRAGHGVKS